MHRFRVHQLFGSSQHSSYLPVDKRGTHPIDTANFETERATFHTCAVHIVPNQENELSLIESVSD